MKTKPDAVLMLVGIISAINVSSFAFAVTQPFTSVPVSLDVFAFTDNLWDIFENLGSDSSNSIDHELSVSTEDTIPVFSQNF